MRLGRWLGFIVALLILVFALAALGMMKRQLEGVAEDRARAPGGRSSRPDARQGGRLPARDADLRGPSDASGPSGPSGPSGAEGDREAEGRKGIPPGAIW